MRSIKTYKVFFSFRLWTGNKATEWAYVDGENASVAIKTLKRTHTKRYPNIKISNYVAKKYNR